jgi:hypothetical protein
LLLLLLLLLLLVSGLTPDEAACLVSGISIAFVKLREMTSYHVSSANLGALPEIAVTHPPDTFCAVYGRA